MFEEKLAGVFAFFASITTYLFGGFDLALQVLAIFIIADFTTGLMKGFYLKSWSSDTGYRGLLKKSGIIFVVLLAHMIDVLTGTEVFRTPVIYFYVALEGISIMENLGSMNVAIPQFLLDRLEQIKNITAEDKKK